MARNLCKVEAEIVFETDGFSTSEIFSRDSLVVLVAAAIDGRRGGKRVPLSGAQGLRMPPKASSVVF